MKKIQITAAVSAMFLIIMAALLTSFQVAIYGDPQYSFYESRYKKYQVTEELHMELSDVMDVTHHMMDYLIGREDTLSFVTNVDGKEQDFFNQQDRIHMADVKTLFLGGLKLRTAFVVLAFFLAVILLAAGKAKAGLLLAKAYAWALAVFLTVILFLGVAFAVDFTACFRIFHEIFFTNDLWLFDPASDYMIRMLPEGFFSDMVLRITFIFLGILLAIGLCFRAWKFGAERKQRGGTN